jgi:hypothetical protein
VISATIGTMRIREKSRETIYLSDLARHVPKDQKRGGAVHAHGSA